MKQSWYGRWRALAVATDLIFISTALVAFTAARFGPASIPDAFVPAPGREFGRAPLLFAIPAWLAVFAFLRLYNPPRSQNALQEARRLVTAGFGAAVALVMLGFLVKENPARSWLVGAMVMGTLGGAIGRQTLRAAVERIRERGGWLTPTLVIGRRQSKAVIEDLATHAAAGRMPVGTCGFSWPGLPEWPLGELGDAVRATRSRELIVVASDLERHEINATLEIADELPVQVVVLPGLDYLLLGSLQLVTVMNEPGLAVEAPSLRGYQGALKRLLDVAFGVALLTLSAPLLMLIAIAIRLDSRGPVILRQHRQGRGRRTFRLLKFRTMKEGSEGADFSDAFPNGAGFISKDRIDPRVTKLGRYLRKASLDELPQLWNVIRGDMSLVGPRPLQPWEAERVALPRRMVVRPGLTGLWQVSGRSNLATEERIRLDLVYVQNWSLLLDFAILLRTVPAVVAGRGAY